MATADLKITYIPRERIAPDPAQPRTDADAELRDSIARRGIIQPITVRRDPQDADCYLIIDGERRWRGAEGVLDEIPCIVRRDDLAVDDVERKLTQLVANTGKELPPLDEARAFMELLLETGWSIEELADKLGRPRSTVGDRVRLMELGPWIPLIESGEVTVSQAVQVLVPLRTVPPEHAEKAIETARKDYRWSRNGKGISIHDFERVIGEAYRPFLYPLRKAGSWEKRPTFNTRNHDDECECGRIKFGDEKRVYCGNPSWWRPLHRKALAEKREKEPKQQRSNGRVGVKLYLPEGTPSVASNYYEPIRGVIALTDSEGKWTLGRGEEQFDPADLPLDELQLVRITSSYSGDRVGTKSVAAVKLAREAWQARWLTRRAELERDFKARITARAGAHRVSAPAAALWAIVFSLDDDHVPMLIECASVCGIPLPAKLYETAAALDWQARQKDVPAWLNARSGEELATLLSAFAVAIADKVPNPLAVLQNQIQGEIKKIAARTVPWTKPPAKGEKAQKPAKAPKGKRGKKSIESPEPAEAEAQGVHNPQEPFELCSFCTEPLTTPEEAARGTHDECGTDDLWDAEAEELEEEEREEEPVDG